MDNAQAAQDRQEQGPILYIVHEYPPIVGGTGVLAQTMIDEISKDRNVIVVTASETTETKKEPIGDGDILKLGIPFRDKEFHYATPPSILMFLILAIWHGWKIGRRTRLRAIHAFHVFPSGLAAVILSRLLGVPCFVTAIGAEIYDPSRDAAFHSKWFYRKLIAAIMKRATRLSAISTDIATRARSYFNRDDIDILPPPLPNPLPVLEKQQDEGFTLCSVSRLARRKGLDFTIKAIALMKELPIRYIIVGDGRYRDCLTTLAKSLGILDRLDFRGFVDDAAKYRILSESDLFVLPSHHEGFGICYIEAMSVGLPVIANSVGGQTDFIVDGENGILLKELHEKELAAAIAHLYHHPDLRERMGIANKEKTKYYLPSNLKEVYLTHYDSVIPR